MNSYTSINNSLV